MWHSVGFIPCHTYAARFANHVWTAEYQFTKANKAGSQDRDFRIGFRIEKVL